MEFDFNRWKHFTAMAIIGDGVMGMIHPRRSAKAWHYGPEPWKNLMQSLEDRPNLTRALSAAQVMGGILWVLYESRGEDRAKRVPKLEAINSRRSA
jgi:hypothetical protein